MLDIFTLTSPSKWTNAPHDEKMCSLTRIRTLDPWNTIPRLYWRSYLAVTHLFPQKKNSSELWHTLTWHWNSSLNFTEQCKFKSELYSVTAPLWGIKWHWLRKCEAWLELEPGTIWISFCCSTNSAQAIQSLTRLL
jgi:hypothetical protein